MLSQAGLLVTHDAPRDMPDRGRMKILWACPAGKNGEVTHLEMPREDLVPYGGAAPVDVFAVRVEDTAILVAVLSTWNDKGHVVLALTSGAATLGEMIRKARRARAQKSAVKKVEARKAGAVTMPGAGARKERTSALPGAPRRERTSSLPRAPKETVAPKKARPRTGSEPEITVGEAPVGRETLIAIEATRPRAGSEPEITVGEAPVGRETLYAIEAALPRAAPGPAPEAMRVQLDSVGRETMLEIERIEAAQAPRAPSVEEPLVVADRKTLPWVDTAAALKRTVDARVAARAAAPPDVKVSVEELDPEALESALRDERR